MPKTWKNAAALCLTAAILTGCGAAPAEQPAAVSTSPAAAEPVMETAVPETAREVFQSQDGTVEFTLELQDIPKVQPMPIVEIQPHFITGQDLERVGKVLLGDIDFYEREPQVGAKYAKAEIQKAIDTLEPLLTREAMEKTFGANTELVDLLPSFAQELKILNEMLLEAPEENSHVLCQWQFQNWKHYNNFEQEPDAGFPVIFSTAELNGNEYLLTAAVDTGEEPKSILTCTMTTNLMDFQLGRALYRAKYCSQKPTEEQVEAVLERAQDYLDRFELGQWTIDEWEITESPADGDVRYTIFVHAAPVLEGYPAVSRFSFQEDPEMQDWYRDAYCYLEFAAGGELMDFDLSSPIASTRLVGEKQPVLPLQELLDIGKDHLSKLSSMDGIGVWADQLQNLQQEAGEEFTCKVQIHTAKLALGRYLTKDGSYQYVPVFLLRGHTEYYGKDSGKLYLTSSEDGYERSLLTVINALDGTVIR